MFLTGFTIGLFGSLHCIGMCGPIAMALPMQKNHNLNLAINGLLYNIGRTLTYGILGLVIGFFGAGLFWAGLQKWISIATGIGLLLIVLLSIDPDQKINSIKWLNNAYLLLKKALGKTLRHSSSSALFISGILNGLLPCGLVYLALATALTAGSLWNSALVMFSFGVGTIPLMLALILVGNKVHSSYRPFFRKLYPVFLILLAFWFIYRGIHFYLPENFQLTAGSTWIPLCH